MNTRLMNKGRFYQEEYTNNMETSQKKTKIVATIGPASQKPEVFEAMVKAGLNMARLNMSHGEHTTHGPNIKMIREVSERLGAPIPILLDLSGPKIRTGTYATERIVIETGKEITLTSQEMVGDASRIYINYPKLPQEVKSGSIILLDDGKKKLEVIDIKGTEIRCKIIVGGELKSRRGVNVPGAYLSIETITEKDKEDLKFGLAAGVDMVALSFVRRAQDVEDLRGLMKAAGREVPIIVKIETQESIENLDAIIAATDGVMVARGDLATEIPTELVPIHQKRMIAECNRIGKPVITATQMLESMIHSPVPTRAEVSDVANAIYDGSDAVMLSEESALGEYPVEAIAMMSRISTAIQESRAEKIATTVSIQDSTTGAVCKTARHIGAKLIVALTETGTTARLISRFKPPQRVIALTPNEPIRRQLALMQGVEPYLFAKTHTLDESIENIHQFIKKHELAKTGDLVVIAAGIDFGVPGSTNMSFVLKI
jgi:pyruvate kinase